MGLFYDLIQDIDISEQRRRANSLEQRVDHLESELAKVRKVLHAVLQKLEQHLSGEAKEDARPDE